MADFSDIYDQQQMKEHMPISFPEKMDREKSLSPGFLQKPFSAVTDKKRMEK